jgi:hypothetical protein
VDLFVLLGLVIAIATAAHAKVRIGLSVVRRWHADPFGFLRPWNEVPALMGSAPPATPPSTGTGVVTFLMG